MTSAEEAAPEIVFDAGAFIAWERNDPRVRALVQLAESGALRLHTSSAVIAQVWRGGPRQARLARLLNADTVGEHPLDPTASRLVGLLAADCGGQDVVDGHVASLARRAHVKVLTSDPGDILGWGVRPEQIIEC